MSESLDEFYKKNKELMDEIEQLYEGKDLNEEFESENEYENESENDSDSYNNESSDYDSDNGNGHDDNEDW